VLGTRTKVDREVFEILGGEENQLRAFGKGYDEWVDVSEVSVMKGRLNKPVLFMLQGTDVEQATPSGNLRRLYSSTSTARCTL